jgi:DNA replication protein DnaC
MLSSPDVRDLIALRLAAVLPVRWRARTLEGYEPETPAQQRALAAAKRIAAGARQSLVLIGPPGRGKTHLAAGIVRTIVEGQTLRWQEALERPASDALPLPPLWPAWVNVPDALARLRLELGAPVEDREEHRRLLRLSRYGGLVVLDDLGRERMSDWTAEVVYAVLNGRYEIRAATVVTTNVPLRDLAQSPYWPAISRLAEDGEIIEVDGPDRRIHKGGR